MSSHEPVVVECLEGPAAARVAADVGVVYAEVFAEPPYGEAEDDFAAAARRFRSQTRRADFRIALARTVSGEPVGLAYGHPLDATTRWWDPLSAAVPAETRREDGRRSFGVLELAVRPPWRGRGVGRRLHDALLEDCAAERAVLNVRCDVVAAQAAYRAWGYRSVGQVRPWEGAVLHDVMLLGLTRPAHTPPPRPGEPGRGGKMQVRAVP
ncbi:GNAT family N-acetyltransferase [Streptomyces sp. NPDC049577]|uniref:GNAT family N-acetyltransferase n=1 Tax=Streptomyces sp. NPDC049577 TaxID=3155153 RepID=UPI0034162704